MLNDTDDLILALELEVLVDLPRDRMNLRYYGLAGFIDFSLFHSVHLPFQNNALRSLE